MEHILQLGFHNTDDNFCASAEIRHYFPDTLNPNSYSAETATNSNIRTVSVKLPDVMSPEDTIKLVKQLVAFNCDQAKFSDNVVIHLGAKLDARGSLCYLEQGDDGGGDCALLWLTAYRYYATTSGFLPLICSSDDTEGFDREYYFGDEINIRSLMLETMSISELITDGRDVSVHLTLCDFTAISHLIDALPFESKGMYLKTTSRNDRQGASVSIVHPPLGTSKSTCLVTSTSFSK